MLKENRALEDRTLVIMFVKEPKLGFVKTRLAKTCGDKFTLQLYQAFVNDLVGTLKGNGGEFKLCAYPCLNLINKNFGNFKNFLQHEGNLGLKMQKAFKEQFEKGYDKIVLIGSDTPHITNDLIAQSFEKLNSNDIVLGPSLDGGYYLIAFNKETFYDEVFNDISWSTPEVLNQTLQKLNKKQVYLLNELNDIDVLEDLTDFYELYHESYFKDSNTIKYLNNNSAWKNLSV